MAFVEDLAIFMIYLIQQNNQLTVLAKFVRTSEMRYFETTRMAIHHFGTQKAENWSTNPWEIAKCYMAPTGYLDVQTSDETDLTGLISVIINFEPFQLEVAENLMMPGNIFEQTREARNSIMHNAKMEISTSELLGHLQTFKCMLSDAKFQQLPAAKNAYLRISDLERGLIVITAEDDMKIKKEIKRANISSLESGKEALNESTKRGLSEISKITEESISKIQKMEEKFKEERSKKTQSSGTSNKDCAKETQCQFTAIEKDYSEKKAKLQRQLIEHYSSVGLVSSPIPVLFDDTEIQVDDMFVMPNMGAIENAKDERQSAASTSNINTIGDIFRKDGQPVKRSCIVGKAGFGKTFLCKRIVSSWCRIHSNQQSVDLPKTDIEFLKSFDLLFYKDLRNCKMNHVEDMIKDSLVCESLHLSLYEVLNKESEKCLIILDGLDEFPCSVGTPILDTRKNYSIIFTSRPWKIESLRPNKCVFGQEIVLNGFEENDIVIKAVIERLNALYGGKKDWTEFKYDNRDEDGPLNFREREEYKKMKHLAEVPVFLIQFICMWYDGKTFGNKRTGMYIEMLEYLFKFAHKRRPIQMRHVLKQSSTEQQNEARQELFQKLNGDDKCLILKLAEFAYSTISKRKEETLIFSHADLNISKLSKEEVEICLTVGILSQEKIHRKVTQQEKLFTFIHKTYQEFLAAVHIACSDESVFRATLCGLDSLDNLMEISPVLIFLVGLKPMVFNETSMHIANLVEKDNRILSYRRSLPDTVPDYTRFVEQIQGIIFECSDECRVDEAIGKPVIELRDIFIRERDHFTGSTRFLEKYFPLLNHHSIKSVCDTTNGNSLVNTKMVQLEKLCFVTLEGHVDNFGRMISSCKSNLVSLHLFGDNDTLATKSIFITMATADYLTALCLESFRFSHNALNQMEKLFSNFKHLRDLSLKDIGCLTCNHNQCYYTIDLRENIHLKYLEVYSIGGNILFNGRVPLEYVKISDMKHECNLIDTLKKSITLKHLDISCDQDTYSMSHENKTLSTSKSVIEVLPTLQYLESITLWNSEFKDGVMTISCQTKGMKIRLNKVKMTIKCLKAFVQSILCSSHKIEVDMDIFINPKQNVKDAKKFIWNHYAVSYEHGENHAQLPIDIFDDDICIKMQFSNNK